VQGSKRRKEKTERSFIYCTLEKRRGKVIALDIFRKETEVPSI